MRVSYPTHLRWKSRIAAGVPPVCLPGPKKVEPFDMDILKNDIDDLKHRRKRSLGADSLYRQYAPYVSRRELQQMVKEARVTCERDRRQALKRIQWLAPGVVSAELCIIHGPDNTRSKPLDTF